MKKLYLITSLALVSLILLLSVVYYFANSYGEATVITEIGSASYTIDGKNINKFLVEKNFVINPPFTLKLKTGKHKLEVTKADYKPFIKEFTLKRNGKKNIEVSMELDYDDGQMEELRAD